MAYVLPPNSILEMQIRGRLSGQQTINVFHYLYAPGDADGGFLLSTAASEFNLYVWPVFAAGLSQDLDQVEIQAQWVYPTRFVARRFGGTPPDGDVADVATPSGVSVVVRRKSDVASRSARGRIYLPAISQNDVLESQLTAGWLALHKANFEAAMIAPLSLTLTDDAVPVIWSYPTPLVTDRVTAGEVDANLRYQRRREVGRGQ